VRLGVLGLGLGLGFGAVVTHAAEKATAHHFLDTNSLCRDDSCFPGFVEGLCFTRNNDFVLCLTFHVGLILNPFAAQPQPSHSHPHANANSWDFIKYYPL